MTLCCWYCDEGILGRRRRKGGENMFGCLFLWRDVKLGAWLCVKSALMLFGVGGTRPWLRLSPWLSEEVVGI